MVAAAPVGMGIIRDRVLLELNERAAAQLGYTRSELIGKSTRMLFHSEEDYERIGKEFYPGFTTKGESQVAAYYQCKDGTPIEVLIRGAYLDPSNPSRGIAFVFLDIFEIKRNERELESKVLALTSPSGGDSFNLRFQDLFDLEEIQKIQDAFADAAGVASIITDAEGEPITQPSRFCRLCWQVIRKTENGRANCIRSDAELGKINSSGPTICQCLSGGLLDGGVAIMVGEHHVANWLIGQVMDDSVDPDLVRSYAARIGADQAEFDSALSEVPRMSRKDFTKAGEALFLIAEQLSKLAYQNVMQARNIAERKRAEDALKESENRLKAAVTEKEALYKELKHRVKNGMAMMAGLVGLESSHHTDPVLLSILSNTRTRIESLANLYDLLGAEGNPQEVRLDIYLSRILDSLSGSFSVSLPDSPISVEFEAELEPFSLHARTAAPLGLVVMELVTNSIKYAFAQSGCANPVIQVQTRRKADHFEVLVADNGIGYPPGFDPLTSGGLGMELIRMLIDQMSGSWKLESGPGARFSFTIPLTIEGY